MSVQDEENEKQIIGQSDFNKLPEIANYSSSRNKRRADSLTLQGDMYTMDSTPRHEGVFHAARTHTDLKNVQSSKANPESVNSSMTHSTEKIVPHAH